MTDNASGRSGPTRLPAQPRPRLCTFEADDGSGFDFYEVEAVDAALTAAEATRQQVEQERDAAIKERDRETRRTDIVIAEFDAPWPHSHTVAERLSEPLIQQIHDCRFVVEDRAAKAERERDALIAQLAALRDMLRAHEWRDALFQRRCSACASTSTLGHRPDCWLAHVLAEARAVDQEACQCAEPAPLVPGAKCRKCHRWTVALVNETTGTMTTIPSNQGTAARAVGGSTETEK